jgi:hypothetical protein
LRSKSLEGRSSARRAPHSLWSILRDAPSAPSGWGRWFAPRLSTNLGSYGSSVALRSAAPFVALYVMYVLLKQEGPGVVARSRSGFSHPFSSRRRHPQSPDKWANRRPSRAGEAKSTKPEGKRPPVLNPIQSRFRRNVHFRLLHPGFGSWTSGAAPGPSPVLCFRLCPAWLFENVLQFRRV